eukprot:224311-Prymnesium_polylepis.1
MGHSPDSRHWFVCLGLCGCVGFRAGQRRDRKGGGRHAERPPRVVHRLDHPARVHLLAPGV